MSTTTSQQFEGTTIEEALAAAVAMFGDDLEIIDAQRVRRRAMLGIRRRERFEVTASGRGKAEPKGFDAVLARMVDRVDQAERSVGSELSDTDLDWWSTADFVVPPASPAAGRPTEAQLASWSRLGAQSETDALGAPPAIDLRAAEKIPGLGAALAATLGEARAAASAALLQTADPVADAASSDPAVGTDWAPAPSGVGAAPPATPAVIVADADPVWSADALLALGLPKALVGRIKHESLSGDLDWVAALARAISELLDTAQSLSGPCELTGHGAESAVHLIRGACDGFRVGSIVIDGRTVPATALELALAVRSLVYSRTSPVGAAR